MEKGSCTGEAIGVGGEVSYLEKRLTQQFFLHKTSNRKLLPRRAQSTQRRLGNAFHRFLCVLCDLCGEACLVQRIKRPTKTKSVVWNTGDGEPKTQVTAPDVPDANGPLVAIGPEHRFRLS